MKAGPPAAVRHKAIVDSGLGAGFACPLVGVLRGQVGAEEG